MRIRLFIGCRVDSVLDKGIVVEVFNEAEEASLVTWFRLI